MTILFFRVRGPRGRGDARVGWMMGKDVRDVWLGPWVRDILRLEVEFGKGGC